MGIALVVKDDVLGLDVPVDYVVVVQILKAKKYTGHKKFSLFFGESPSAADMISEITSGHQIHYEIESLSVLERTHHIDNERVLEGCQQFLFVEDTRDALLGDYAKSTLIVTELWTFPSWRILSYSS